MAVAMATATMTAPLCLTIGVYVEVPLVDRGVDSATRHCRKEGSDHSNVALEGRLCTNDIF